MSPPVAPDPSTPAVARVDWEACHAAVDGVAYRLAPHVSSSGWDVHRDDGACVGYVNGRETLGDCAVGYEGVLAALARVWYAPGSTLAVGSIARADYAEGWVETRDGTRYALRGENRRWEVLLADGTHVGSVRPQGDGLVAYGLRLPDGLVGVWGAIPAHCQRPGAPPAATAQEPEPPLPRATLSADRRTAAYRNCAYALTWDDASATVQQIGDHGGCRLLGTVRHGGYSYDESAAGPYDTEALAALQAACFPAPPAPPAPAAAVDARAAATKEREAVATETDPLAEFSAQVTLAGECLIAAFEEISQRLDDALRRSATLEARLQQLEADAVPPSREDLARSVREALDDTMRRLESDRTQEDPVPKPEPQESTLDTLLDDTGEAARRTAGRQLLKLTKEPFVALLERHLAPGDAAARGRIAAFLETELGTALFAELLSLGLQTLPGGRTLARELRVQALAGATDVLADLLMGPVREVMGTYLRDPPEATAAPAGLPDGARPGVTPLRAAEAQPVTVAGSPR